MGQKAQQTTAKKDVLMPGSFSEFSLKISMKEKHQPQA
jgi:hypothetical protein